MFPTDPHFDVKFGGVAATCPAWFFANPQELLGRGQVVDVNHQMPGVPGRLLRDPIQDQLIFDGIWEIGSDVASNGTPHANPVTGYAANRRAWLAAFFDVATVTRSVGVTVEAPDGTKYAGPVQFGEPRFVETLTGGTAYMRIVVASGQLAEVP